MAEVVNFDNERLTVVSLDDDHEIEVVVAADLEGEPVPERCWLVPGWIPMGAVTAIYGDGGVGKSLAAQMLLTAVATGRPWFGIEARAGGAFGFFCEDDGAELHRRQMAINRAMGVTFDDLGGLAWTSRVGRDNVLARFPRRGEGEVTALFDSLKQVIEQRAPDVVVIDTAADTFGGNEIDRGEVRWFVSAALGRLARQTGIAVVLLAHPSVSGMKEKTGLSGSTAWNASVRSRLYLAREEGEDADGGLRVLRRLKANYGPTDGEIKLRWQDGAFHLVERAGSRYSALDHGAVEEVVLAGIAKLIAQGLYPSKSKCARDSYAPKMLKRTGLAGTWAFKDIEAAIWRLLGDGRLMVEVTPGSPSKRKDYLAPGQGVRTPCEPLRTLL